jgi:two-component system, OmpR family, sensor histidine kinase KdpD
MKKPNPYLSGLLFSLATTSVCFWQKDALELTSIAMLHLLPILFTAVLGGIRRTIFISLVSITLFDVLFVPPVLHLTVHDARYLLSFVIMFCVGILVAILAKKAAKIKELEASEKLGNALWNSLSHELRTPLSSIIGASSIIMNKELALKDKQKEVLNETVMESAKKMQRLVENLLADARFESGHIKPSIGLCDLKELAYTLVTSAEGEYQKNIALDVEDKNISVLTDAGLLEQIIKILLDNAFKYGNEIKMSVYTDKPYILIKICNDGKIPTQKDIGEIGKKFTRFSNASDKNGIGLGFFLSKKIAELLEADIDANIDDGFFCVQLKIRESL